MSLRKNFVLATIAAGLALATPAFAGDFFFTTGNADGLLGALSRSDSPGKVETETADDFVLTQTTIISGATIVGLVNAAVANITNVEVEVYNRFRWTRSVSSVGATCSRASTRRRTSKSMPPRAMEAWERSVLPQRQLSANFHRTEHRGKRHQPESEPAGPAARVATSGAEVEDHHHVHQADPSARRSLFLSPGGVGGGWRFPVAVGAAGRSWRPARRSRSDLQAWIRNARLAPDWVRIGTDVIVPRRAAHVQHDVLAGGRHHPRRRYPGRPELPRDSISALARQFGGIRNAASPYWDFPAWPRCRNRSGNSAIRSTSAAPSSVVRSMLADRLEVRRRNRLAAPLSTSANHDARVRTCRVVIRWNSIPTLIVV